MLEYPFVVVEVVDLLIDFYCYSFLVHILSDVLQSSLFFIFAVVQCCCCSMFLLFSVV